VATRARRRRRLKPSNELLACYGTDRKQVASFEERTGKGGFIDMIWPGVCLIEMKRPSEGEKLENHRFQALEYWKEVSRKAVESGQPAPEWIVVCAFERFLILGKTEYSGPG